MKKIQPLACLTCVLLAILACLLPLHAETTLDAGAKGVKKTVVTDSMLGYRDTLVFYVFGEANAVLEIRIGNENLDFPVSAKLHTFADGTDAEAIGKWINNQHSDGLFIDAAKPEATHAIPAASCVTGKHDFMEQAESHNGKFSKHSVTFRIKDVPPLGGFTLKDFTDQVNVFVKAGGA